jgi:hypothetical protein
VVCASLGQMKNQKKWVKEDNMPNLGPFTVNPGVKQILSDPTKV